MRLHRLQISNFGPHKDRSFEFHNAPVIGISGPNGSGKTNIIEAIRLTFTGGLLDHRSSYVLNTAEAAGLNAVVQTAFSKHGVEGSVYRRFGASSKSTIKWAGEKEIGSVAGVTAKLKEIFGADTEAIAAAVFIPQGDMDKILFGTPAEREELFVKLLLMSHMSKVEAAADRRLGGLRAMVLDLAPLIDALRTARDDADANLVSCKVALGAKPDLSECCTAVRAHLADLQAHRDATEKLAAANAAWIVTKERLPKGNVSREEMEAKLTECDARLAELRDQKAAVTQWLDLRTQETVSTTNIRTLEDQLADVRISAADLPQVNVDVMEAAWRTFNIAAGNLETANAKLGTARRDAENLPQERANLEANRMKQEDAEAQVKKIDEEAGTLSMVLNVAAALDKLTGGHAVDKCPICESVISEDFRARFTPDRILQTKLRNQTLAEQKAALTRDILKCRGQHDALTTKIANAETVLKHWEAEVRKAEAALTELRQPDIGVAELRDIRAKRQELQQRDTYIGGQLQMARQQHAALTARVKALGAQGWEDRDVSALRSALDRITAEHVTQSLARTTLFSDLSALKTLLAAEQKAHAEYDAAAIWLHACITAVQDSEKRRKASLAGFPAHLLPLVPGQVDDVAYESELLRAIEGHEAERQQMVGAVREAERAVQEAADKLAEMNAKEEKQAKVKQACADLEALRTTFMRKNLPKAYVERKFADLFGPTVELLQSLGADYIIEADPENPLTYTFTRPAHPDILPLPMKRLSGGQKVRLTLATLIALQRTILSDVGLLVLDEPAYGLDEDGLEAFRDTLEGLQATLRNSDLQIVMCDHHKELEPAYSYCIRL